MTCYTIQTLQRMNASFSLESSAVSVSLSPTSRYLLVGLAIRTGRLILSPTERTLMGQIFRGPRRRELFFLHCLRRIFRKFCLIWPVSMESRFRRGRVGPRYKRLRLSYPMAIKKYRQLNAKNLTKSGNC